MNKNVRKIAGWIMLILMFGSFIATIVGYIISSN